MTDMRPVLFEPASAIAAGICLTARTISDGRTARHPRPCGWCTYEPDDLRAMVSGFNAWAGYDERAHTYDRLDARAFQGLPVREQQQLVLEAQAFPPDEPAAAVPAVAEVPEWMR
jgi:hypothetical protein